MKSTAICACIVGLLTAAVNAANITWQTPANISAASDVSTAGTLYGSWAPGDDYQGDFNSAPQNYTVNGVAFNTYGTPGVDFAISGSGITSVRL